MEAGDQVLNEGEFERRRDRLEALSDGQLVFALLTCNDVARRATRGRVRELIEHEAFALIAALERFAPQALERGLALYDGERGWAEG